MKDFHTMLAYLNDKIYEPNNLRITATQEEKQNFKYCAGTFELFSKKVRFRVAKETPKKVGQFVTIWEKDTNNVNQPYSYDGSPDLFVITTFKNNNEFGQFIFPKNILLKQGILSSDNTKGKMAMRVYPSWDRPTNKQAVNTQKWQLQYFVDLRSLNQDTKNRLVDLYAL